MFLFSDTLGFLKNILGSLIKHCNFETFNLLFKNVSSGCPVIFQMVRSLPLGAGCTRNLILLCQIPAGQNAFFDCSPLLNIGFCVTMVMHTLWLKIIYQYSYPSVCFVFKELSIY